MSLDNSDNEFEYLIIEKQEHDETLMIEKELTDLKAKLKIKDEALKECVSQLEWHNQPEPCASTNVVLKRMYTLLGRDNITREQNDI